MTTAASVAPTTLSGCEIAAAEHAPVGQRGQPVPEPGRRAGPRGSARSMFRARPAFRSGRRSPPAAWIRWCTAAMASRQRGAKARGRRGSRRRSSVPAARLIVRPQRPPVAITSPTRGTGRPSGWRERQGRGLAEGGGLGRRTAVKLEDQGAEPRRLRLPCPSRGGDRSRVRPSADCATGAARRQPGLAGAAAIVLAMAAESGYMRATQSTGGGAARGGDIPVQSTGWAERLFSPLRRKPEKEDREPWLCLNSLCASSWKPASTSATRPTAGTRAWGRTSTATATASTSST